MFLAKGAMAGSPLATLGLFLALLVLLGIGVVAIDRGWSPGTARRILVAGAFLVVLVLLIAVARTVGR